MFLETRTTVFQMKTQKSKLHTVISKTEIRSWSHTVFISHLWGLPVGHNSPLPRSRKSDHSPWSMAKPSLSPRKHGCTSYAPPHRWCDRASAPSPSHSAEPAPSNQACGFQGCTRWAGTQTHSKGGTRHRPQLLPESCGRWCLGTWSECRPCPRSRTVRHLCIWLS